VPASGLSGFSGMAGQRRGIKQYMIQNRWPWLAASLLLTGLLLLALRLFASPLVDADNRPNGWMASLYDLTLFLSGHGDIPLVASALKQGALDFLEKPVDHRTLLDAIAKAIASDTRARNVHQTHTSLSREIAELTLCEREVLSEIVAGYLSKQIASHLHISTKTVEAHRLHICQKLNVHTSMELVAKLRDVPPQLWQKQG
jgi:two-component system response regulator DctR